MPIQRKGDQSTRARRWRQHCQSRYRFKRMPGIAMELGNTRKEPVVANSVFHPLQNCCLSGQCSRLATTQLETLCAICQFPFNSFLMLDRPVSNVGWGNIVEGLAPYIKCSGTIWPTEPLLHRDGIEIDSK